MLGEERWEEMKEGKRGRDSSKMIGSLQRKRIIRLLHNINKHSGGYICCNKRNDKVKEKEEGEARVKNTT